MTVDMALPEIRATLIDGKVWFHGRDALTAVGAVASGSRGGTAKMLTALPQSEKRLVPSWQFKGPRGPGAWFISEGGLCRIIARHPFRQKPQPEKAQEKAAMAEDQFLVAARSYSAGRTKKTAEVVA